VLKEYITQGAHKLSVSKPPQAVTNIVSWRPEGVRYKKNEVFLDVVEKLNCLVAANGSVISSEIIGAVKMKCQLTGMPELKLGLNDKAMFEAQGRAEGAAAKRAVELEDIKFHQCVRLTRFESDRTISFIPPDGEFELMSYRLNTTVKPLVWVETVIEAHGRSRVEYMVKARSQFKTRSFANNVEVFIPVPPDVDSPAFKASVGTVTYVPDLDAIKWTIKQFHGGKEALMRAHFGLPSVASGALRHSRAEHAAARRRGRVASLPFRAWMLPLRLRWGAARARCHHREYACTILLTCVRVLAPASFVPADAEDADKWRKRSIQVKFEIPYFTVSGIQVRYLKILEKSGYSALPWVRYITQNGDYQLRMA